MCINRCNKCNRYCWRILHKRRAKRRQGCRGQIYRALEWCGAHDGASTPNSPAVSVTTATSATSATNVTIDFTNYRVLDVYEFAGECAKYSIHQSPTPP